METCAFTQVHTHAGVHFHVVTEVWQQSAQHEVIWTYITHQAALEEEWVKLQLTA